MPVTTQIPKNDLGKLIRAPIKGFLAAYDDPNVRMLFQYNPPEITETKEMEWPEIVIPGADDALANFGAGKSFKLAFTLFFNEVGESYVPSKNIDTRPFGLNVPTDLTDTGNRTEMALAFLHSFTETQQATDQYMGLSPRILLFWFGDAQFGTGAQYGATGAAGPAMIVRLTKLTVKRGMFDKQKLVTRRATAEIELTRHALFPR